MHVHEVPVDVLVLVCSIRAQTFHGVHVCGGMPREYLSSNRFKVLKRYTALAVLLAFLPVLANAQVANVTDTEATPIPGAGHDYLGTLNETVDPATGSLSLRIEVPVPKGRGLTVPFSFNYDSNGAILSVSPHPLQTNPFVDTGWSYSVPSMSVYRNTVKGGTKGDPETCYYYSGYVFTDLMGTRHSFLNLVYTSTGTPDGCQFLGYSSNLSDSDPWFSVQAEGSGLGGSVLAVQDADGTTYTFGMTGGLPTSIEDRNGNLVKYNYSGSGVLTATDTAGRSVITTNGFGATGNTVAVSGLPNPYKLTWGASDSWNYNTNQT